MGGKREIFFSRHFVNRSEREGEKGSDGWSGDGNATRWGVVRSLVGTTGWSQDGDVDNSIGGKLWQRDGVHDKG